MQRSNWLRNATSVLTFVVVGPLIGCALLVATMFIVDPSAGAPSEGLLLLPFIMLGAYFVGAIPAFASGVILVTLESWRNARSVWWRCVRDGAVGAATSAGYFAWIAPRDAHLLGLAACCGAVAAIACGAFSYGWRKQLA